MAGNGDLRGRCRQAQGTLKFQLLPGHSVLLLPRNRGQPGVDDFCSAKFASGSGALVTVRIWEGNRAHGIFVEMWMHRCRTP